MNKALHPRYVIVYIGYAIAMSMGTIEFFTWIFGISFPFPTFSTMEYLGYNCVTMAYHDSLIFIDNKMGWETYQLFHEDMRYMGIQIIDLSDPCKQNTYEKIANRFRLIHKLQENPEAINILNR